MAVHQQLIDRRIRFDQAFDAGDDGAVEVVQEGEAGNGQRVGFRRKIGLCGPTGTTDLGDLQFFEPKLDAQQHRPWSNGHIDAQTVHAFNKPDQSVCP